MLVHNVLYGSNQSQMSHIDNAPILDARRTERLQIICGIFLYRSKTLDFCIGRLSMHLAQGRKNPLKKLNFQPQYSITYRQSDMRFITHAAPNLVLVPVEFIMLETIWTTTHFCQ